ncbi:MAG: HDOD domain-containing protein [Labilithrix sp.]|nr:HDOD domain-containing protein [Labilithrix sp.]MCW5835080.1 HDOD domain-containing protein [Labilithrix sp.]
MKVLFVDDEPRVLEAIQRMLSDAAGSWEVITASSGPEALAMLEESRFDVIVTDIRMPGMDGAALLSKVHERWPSMTRIVLSGHTDQEHAMRAIGSAHQFLSKPCSPKKLTEVVENAFYLSALTPNSRIRELAAAVHRLPAMPKVHERILTLIDGSNASVRDAADLVSQDPGLCAKILRVVNSAFFARGQVVRDVRTATARVGLDLLRALVLSERASCGLSGKRVEQIQRDALDAAAVTMRIVSPDDQRTAFTAALLCDVGTLVLEQGAPDEIAAVRAHAAESLLPLHVAEKELLGSSHADVGGYVLGLWGVPPVIVDAVLGHHDLGRDPSALSAAVYVAHCIVAGDVVSAEAAERAGVASRLAEIRQAYIEDKYAA